MATDPTSRSARKAAAGGGRAAPHARAAAPRSAAPAPARGTAGAAKARVSVDNANVGRKTSVPKTAADKSPARKTTAHF